MIFPTHPPFPVSVVFGGAWIVTGCVSYSRELRRKKKAITNTEEKGWDWQCPLDGRVKPITGCLPMAMQAKASGYADIFVPAANAPEAAVIDGISVWPVNQLSEVVSFLTGPSDLKPCMVDIDTICVVPDGEDLDVEDVQGQEHAKRALEVAAAGGHNVLTLHGI